MDNTTSPAPHTFKCNHAGRFHLHMAVSALVLLCFFLSCTSTALAEPKEYGPDYQRFVLDVPNGWQELVLDNGLLLSSPDKSSVICLRLCPREGKTIDALARKAARNLSVSGIRKQDDRTWTLSVTSENIRVRSTIQAMNNAVIVTSIAGENETTQAILATLRAKE